MLLKMAAEECFSAIAASFNLQIQLEFAKTQISLLIL